MSRGQKCFLSSHGSGTPREGGPTSQCYPAPSGASLSLKASHSHPPPAVSVRQTALCGSQPKPPTPSEMKSACLAAEAVRLTLAAWWFPSRRLVQTGLRGALPQQARWKGTHGRPSPEEASTQRAWPCSTSAGSPALISPGCPGQTLSNVLPASPNRI